MSFTSLDFLDDNYVYADNNSETVDLTNISEIQHILIDPETSPESRKNVISRLHLEQERVLLDIAGNLASSYVESRSSHLREVLNDIGACEELPFGVRLYILGQIEGDVESLVDFCYKKSKTDSSTEFNHTLAFETLRSLANSSCRRGDSCRARMLMCQIASDLSLDEEFRYKLVSSLTSEEQTSNNEELRAFFYSAKNYRYVVISARLLSRLLQLSKEDHEYMFSFCTDDKSTADVCDFLLQSSHEDVAKRAREMLFSLKGADSNIYESSQSVHQVSANIEAFIEKLMDFPSESIGFIKSQLGDDLDQTMARIELDSALYSTKALSLQNILGRVWSAIAVHEHREALQVRLREELREMAETCSTGHLLRMVNVFSGFEEGITLSVKDELRGVVAHRIRSIISKLPGEVIEKIVLELGTGQEEVIMQKLYSEIAVLYEELLRDYKVLFSASFQETQFTEWFRELVIEYLQK